MTTPEFSLLQRLERYYDTVPRARSRIEEVGPFTLFVAESGWPYYARPRLGGRQEITADDVRRVLARQRELDVPQAIEWVDVNKPCLADAVQAAGMAVTRCPLLVLDGAPRGIEGTARILDVDEEADILASRAAVSVGFDNGGTATGAAGVQAREAATATQRQGLDVLLHRMSKGELRTAAAFAPDAPDLGPVGGGGYSPVGDVAEIAGVAVLPAYRRQGLGAQVTRVLAADALARGVTTVFCSAQSDDVARVYQGIGFRRLTAVACIAEVDASH